jgi:transposase
LTDAQWARIERHRPGRDGLPGRSGTDNRLFVDAVFWLARTASPWGDPPPKFDKWTGVHARFRRWAMAGVWVRLFNELSMDPDLEYVLIDSTICKAHADATCATGAQTQRTGRSRGGPTTNIHAAVDALGLPVRLIPTAGQRGDCPLAAALIEGFEGVGHVIADAAYDASHLHKLIVDSLGAEDQIQANPSRAIKPPLDLDLFAERHKVENFFQQIKRFRRIARRCEKTLASFMGFVSLVSALDWLR